MCAPESILIKFVEPYRNSMFPGVPVAYSADVANENKQLR
jgi:hypothetical protein